MNYIERPHWQGGTDVIACQTSILSEEGECAFHFMKQLAIATCVPDGEDSSGRQKFRLMTPAEVTQRAIEMSAQLWDDAAAAGWTLQLPTPKKPTIEY